MTVERPARAAVADLVLLAAVNVALDAYAAEGRGPRAGEEDRPAGLDDEVPL